MLNLSHNATPDRIRAVYFAWITKLFCYVVKRCEVPLDRCQ